MGAKQPASSAVATTPPAAQRPSLELDGALARMKSILPLYDSRSSLSFPVSGVNESDLENTHFCATSLFLEFLRDTSIFVSSIEQVVIPADCLQSNPARIGDREDAVGMFEQKFRGMPGHCLTPQPLGISLPSGY